MVAAFDFCLHGKGGAVPSIDTPMHGLVEGAHVNHLHPDPGIAFATANDGEALINACFGNRVLWIALRRPGFQLGLEIAQAQRDHPEAIAVVLGGHGITAWGETSEQAQTYSLALVRDASSTSTPTAARSRSARCLPGQEPLPEQQRRERAAALLPVVRRLASTDRPQVGHWNDDERVLDFVTRAIALCRQQGQPEPTTPVALVRCIVDSLALAMPTPSPTPSGSPDGRWTSSTLWVVAPATPCWLRRRPMPASCRWSPAQ